MITSDDSQSDVKIIFGKVIFGGILCNCLKPISINRQNNDDGTDAILTLVVLK